MSKLVGHYMEEVKEGYIASALSGLNLCYISSPGWGKTESAKRAAAAVAGDNWLKLEITPSSPPELVTGPYNPALIINEGRMERIVKGSAYDPDAHIVILDEFARGNEPLNDALIHATDQKDIPVAERPVFWGTSNFPLKGERAGALVDRFGLWVYIKPDMNIADMTRSHLLNGSDSDPDFVQGFPTWDQIVEIRKSVPSENAIKAITAVIEALADEIRKDGKFSLNPRRVTQWCALLHTVSTFYYGSPDYATVHPKAVGMLRFAYPCLTQEAANAWAKLASSVADNVGAAIEAIYSVAKAKIDQALAAPSPEEKTRLVAGLGMTLKEAADEMRRIGGGDPRVKEFLMQLNMMFSEAVAKHSF